MSKDIINDLQTKEEKIEIILREFNRIKQLMIAMGFQVDNLHPLDPLDPQIIALNKEEK